MRFALALLGLLFSSQSYAAAWTEPKGQGQVVSNFTYYTSDRYVSNRGDYSRQPTYNKFEYNPYVEYGLTNAVTFGLSPSFQYVGQSSFGEHGESYNLADSDMFLRARLWKDEQNVVSIQPLVKLPGLYDKTDLPALGQSQVDYELRLLYGRNFGLNGQHYWDAEAAYRMREGTPGDEWRVSAALGYRIDERWQLLGEAQGIFAVDGAGSSGQLLSNSFDYDLVKLQLSSIYSLNPRWALQCGMFKDVYSRNTGEGIGGLFSIWFKF